MLLNSMQRNKIYALVSVETARFFDWSVHSVFIDAALEKAFLAARRRFAGVIAVETGGAEAAGIVRELACVFNGEIAEGIDAQFFTDFFERIFGGDEVFLAVDVDAEIAGVAETAARTMRICTSDAPASRRQLRRSGGMDVVPRHDGSASTSTTRLPATTSVTGESLMRTRLMR